MPPIFQLGASRQHVRSLVGHIVKERISYGQSETESRTASSFHFPHTLYFWEDLEDLGFRRDVVEEALETSGSDVDKAVDFLLNNREFMQLQPSQANTDLLPDNFLAPSRRIHPNKSQNRRIICSYPVCPRSQLGNGYPNPLAQQAHMREMHGWSSGRDLLKGLSVDRDDFIRARSGKILALALRLSYTESHVGLQVGEAGQIRNSQGTLLSMALYGPEMVRLLEPSDEEPFDTSNPASAKLPSDRRNEDQEQRMYMHYTISRDMTGSNDEVATKLLAALGERSRETRFKNADLTLLGSKK